MLKWFLGTANEKLRALTESPGLSRTKFRERHKSEFQSLISKHMNGLKSVATEHALPRTCCPSKLCLEG